MCTGWIHNTICDYAVLLFTIAFLSFARKSFSVWRVWPNGLLYLDWRNKKTLSSLAEAERRIYHDWRYIEGIGDGPFVIQKDSSN